MLLSSDLVPCLAITVLVATLGLDTSGNMLGGHSAMHSSSSGAGSSTAVRASTAQGSSQQAAPASGSSSTSSSSGRLGNGISLDSLTPLSRGLFGLLGVDQGVLLQAAEGVDAVWGSGFEPDYFGGIVNACCGVLVGQVSRQQLSQAAQCSTLTPKLGDTAYFQCTSDRANAPCWLYAAEPHVHVCRHCTTICATHPHNNGICYHMSAGCISGQGFTNLVLVLHQS
jgi:hypothetical protein